VQATRIEVVQSDVDILRRVGWLHAFVHALCKRAKRQSTPSFALKEWEPGPIWIGAEYVTAGTVISWESGGSLGVGHAVVSVADLTIPPPRLTIT
jgi:hypothetical protein